MRKITEIIVHCTATPEGRQVSVADVDSWHRRQGLSSIGYHYLVGIDGAVGRGRPETAVGAHCRGHNACSIGVCYVGGCDTPDASGRYPHTGAAACARRIAQRAPRPLSASRHSLSPRFLDESVSVVRRHGGVCFAVRCQSVAEHGVKLVETTQRVSAES